MQDYASLILECQNFSSSNAFTPQKKNQNYSFLREKGEIAGN